MGESQWDRIIAYESVDQEKYFSPNESGFLITAVDRPWSMGTQASSRNKDGKNPVACWELSHKKALACSPYPLSAHIRGVVVGNIHENCG